MIRCLVPVCFKTQENVSNLLSVIQDCAIMVRVFVKMAKNALTVVNVFKVIANDKVQNLAISMITRKESAQLNQTAHIVQILNSVPLMSLASVGIVVFKMVKIVQTLTNVRLLLVTTQRAKQFQMAHSVRNQLNVKQVQCVQRGDVVF